MEKFISLIKVIPGGFALHFHALHRPRTVQYKILTEKTLNVNSHFESLLRFNFAAKLELFTAPSSREQRIQQGTYDEKLILGEAHHLILVKI